MGHFYAYLYRLRLIDRWSLMRNTTRESAAEHSFQVALLTHALCSIARDVYGKTVDADRAVVLALFHDATEVITGDVPTPVKHHNPAILAAMREVEGLAADRLLGMVPPALRATYRPLIEPGPGTRPTPACGPGSRPRTSWTLTSSASSSSRPGTASSPSPGASWRSRSARSPLPEVRYFLEHFAPSFERTLDELTEGAEGVDGVALTAPGTSSDTPPEPASPGGLGRAGRRLSGGAAPSAWAPCIVARLLHRGRPSRRRPAPLRGPPAAATETPSAGCRAPRGWRRDAGMQEGLNVARTTAGRDERGGRRVGIPDLPCLRAGGPGPPLGLRRAGRRGAVQGLGLHRAGLWLQLEGAQRGRVRQRARLRRRVAPPDAGARRPHPGPRPAGAAAARGRRARLPLNSGPDGQRASRRWRRRSGSTNRAGRGVDH